jgi:PPOX class probable F420-dependent enzyme
VINSLYLSLTTYRADGSEVSTPVWVVSDNERRLLVWTGKATGKVKRILGNPSVMVAPCTIRGRETAARVPGRAQVLPAAAMPLVVDLLRKKYGCRRRGWNSSIVPAAVRASRMAVRSRSRSLFSSSARRHGSAPVPVLPSLAHP